MLQFNFYTQNVYKCDWQTDTVEIGPVCKADSRLAPSQWETSLQSNGISHWLGANLESAVWVVAYGGIDVWK